MEALRSADEIRDVNTRYHDVAAETYDSKWGIDFGEIGRTQVLGKLRKLLGAELDDGYDRSLERGPGTGYFSLNLLQAGIVAQATCTDISPGMVATLNRNAQRLGLDVRTARADAEALPFADQSFDLVLGHAVLHHLPNTFPTSGARSRSSTACCDPAGGSCSRASPRASATGSRRCPNAAPTRSLPCGGG
jgi:ubiquinone/menaquinone biosynthesis C-methylase UbiE